MGKVRRQRRKLHISDNATSNANHQTKSYSEISQSSGQVPMFTEPEAFNNIFAGIDIPVHDLKSLGGDCRSVTSTSKSAFKGTGLKKDERRKLRHQTFIAQLQAIHALKNQKKKKSKKNSGAGQIMPSFSGIPYTDIKLREDYDKAPPKKRGIPKANSRHKLMLKSVTALRKMWENPAFKADPIGLVSDLVQERIAKEAE